MCLDLIIIRFAEYRIYGQSVSFVCLTRLYLNHLFRCLLGSSTVLYQKKYERILICCTNHYDNVLFKPNTLNPTPYLGSGPS